MTLARHVRTLGRGPGRSRSLTQDEAFEAMTLMLSDAPPEAVGALLMLLRMKGETPEEIAGLAAAAQDALEPVPQADLDWPSYAAGRTRGAPLFLLSARVVAQAGHRVLMHGWNGSDPKVRAGLAQAGIAVADDAADAERLLARDRIAYLPLETLHPALFRLLNLRAVLGLRSCVNTVCRMLNPARAEAGVQGVFHPSYRPLQADAALLLGWRNLSVIKGGGGEFECHPAKDIACFGLRNGASFEDLMPARIDQTRSLAGSDDPSLSGFLPGFLRDGPPAFETAVVLATAQLALETLGRADAGALAADLWSARDRSHAA